jgi:uncharacterized protein (TIGR00269 family)
MKCDLCKNDAVTFIKYNGSHLCAEHFMRYVEKRVKREIRKQINVKPGDIIAVAVSGGKDSMLTLHLIHSIFGERRDIEIHCITVDEGIEGYRPSSIPMVERYCRDNGIPFHLISYRETFGLTMDDVAPLAADNSPCTYCGVFRRKCMNSVAKDIGATYLATGHNLDDMAQSIMMNFVRGDVERLARLGPHKRVQPGLIPRFYPLRTIPEKESLLYAIVSGMEFHNAVCPYWEAALRNQYRDVIDELEARSPGSKFSILSSYDSLLPMLSEQYKPGKLKVCQCGEPMLGDKCKACELSEKMRSKIVKHP